MNRFLFFLQLLFISINTVAQKQQVSVACDILLCDKMFTTTPDKYPSFLDNVCLTQSRHILLASKDSLYLLGFGGYVTYSPKEKTISAYCLSDSIIYYSNRKRLVAIMANGTENFVLTLPFAPTKLWGGVKAVYATYSNKGNDFLYVMLPEDKVYIKVLELKNNPFISVMEFEGVLYAVTSKSLYIMDVRHGEYTNIPLALDITGRIHSATIDSNDGVLYLSGSKGIFRYYQDKMQKISTDQGYLCFDNDGLIVFNVSNKFMCRIRNNYLYPQPAEVRIEIK